MKVKFKSEEEILFNIEHYHGVKILSSYKEWAHEIGGTFCEIIAKPENLELAGSCDLPVFRLEGTVNRYICGHLCEID